MSEAVSTQVQLQVPLSPLSGSMNDKRTFWPHFDRINDIPEMNRNRNLNAENEARNMKHAHKHFNVNGHLIEIINIPLTS